jgi:hypothetical protein
MTKLTRKSSGAQGDDETMNVKTIRTIAGAALAVLMLSAAFAGSASASPVWKFEQEPLTGSETILGGAEKSGMTVPGMTTTCANFLYEIDIENKLSAGIGDLEDVPLFDCTTDADACSVSSIEAQSLPWSTSLTKVGTQNYISIKGVDVDIVYGGEECVLSGLLIEVGGSAGGLIDNEDETAEFNSSSFSAIGAVLEVFGEPIEWNGLFPTEAFESHRGEELSVS